MITLRVNGEAQTIDAELSTPLLWVLRDNLGITSVKYTCGIAECGVCTVLLNGEATRSCAISIADAAGCSPSISSRATPNPPRSRSTWQ